MSEEKSSAEGILVAAFVEEDAAENAAKALKEAKKQKQIEYWDTAVIRRDAKGEYHYKETKDTSAGKGAAVGAVIGGVIGILGGPAGVVLGAGTGAVVGGFVANSDSGFKDADLEKIGHALQSGNSALVAVTSHEYLKAAQTYAAEENVTAVLQKLSEAISDHMTRGQNVAYVVTAAGRSVSFHQVASDDPIAQLMGIPLTDK